jgi:peptidyl-prolyl cis-trans isomerase B (cyclophilin B)
VHNWDSLVAIGFYDSIAFHRVIPGFMIQGGDPNTISGEQDTWGYGGSGKKLKAEFSAVSHQRGILSAARTSDPNSATSQFFICIGSPTHLDRQYSVYGKVVSGMAVADSIVSAETDDADRPLEKIIMFITRIGSNDSLTAMPQLASPPHDTAVSATTNVTLRWHKVPDAMLYTVQVATDADFTDMVVNTDIKQIDTSVRVTGLTAGKMYYWRVRANNGGNVSEFSAAWRFTNGQLDVEVPEQSSVKFTNVWPHPITEDATIGFSLREGAVVTLSVVDLFGRTVVTPIRSEYRHAGEHEVEFDARAVARGVYLVKLEAEGKVCSRQIVVE